VLTLIYQLPRNSLVWMLFAQAALILPHVQHLPAWLLFAWSLVVLWRIQIFRGIWGMPSTLIKAALVGLSGLGIKLAYGTLLGIDPMVGLLITAFLLKLLEMHTRRDALVVIFLGFFVASTQFLYDQTIFGSLYGLLTILLLVITLLSVNQAQVKPSFSGTGMRGTKLFLQSLPLMFLLFAIMPRLGALWSVPQQRSAAQTGVSDSMSPGDFTNLTRSGKLAFRVSFEGEVPARRDLYWRGLVFSEFDGRTWSPSSQWLYLDGAAINWQNQKPFAWRNNLEISPNASQFNYSVVLEATQQPWLYLLGMPNDIPQKAGLSRPHTLVSKGPVRQRRQYYLSTAIDYKLERELSQRQRGLETALPKKLNPETRRRAELWQRESNSTAELIDRLLKHYHDRFVYTLKTPDMGRHTVDEFLWGTQRGFCEHFASSFVFFMRAAGIPARVVAGYQGGELSPAGDYLLVHHFDAHAWAEVWLPDQGWVRVDPTASVAPERIEQGLSDALSDDDSDLVAGPLSLIYYRNIDILNKLRLQWDSLNYHWYQRVVGYDDEQQTDFFRDWLGGEDPWRVALALIGGAAAVLGSLALWVWYGSRRVLDPVTRAYYSMQRRLEREGLTRGRGEAPRDFTARVKQTRPDLAAQVTTISQLYEKVMYGGYEALTPELKRQARKFSHFS